MRYRTLYWFLSVMVMVLLTAPASADTLYFGQDLSGSAADDADPFDAEAGFRSHFAGYFMEDFESGSGIDFGNGITATASNGYLGSAQSETHFGSGYWVTSRGTQITFTFSAPVPGFGLWLGDLDYGANIFLALDGGDPLDVPDFVNSGGTSDEIAFLGIAADPFSSATLSGLTAWIDYDNLQIGSAATPVPEPGTAVLLAVGFGALGLIAMRRHGRKAPVRNRQDRQ